MLGYRYTVGYGGEARMSASGGVRAAGGGDFDHYTRTHISFSQEEKTGERKARCFEHQLKLKSSNTLTNFWPASLLFSSLK